MNLNEERNAEEDATQGSPRLKELHTMRSSKPQPDLNVNMHIDVQVPMTSKHVKHEIAAER